MPPQNVPAPDDPEDLALRLAATLREYPGEAATARRILESALYQQDSGSRAAPEPVPVPEISEALAKPLLSARGHSGMVLGEGMIALLSAETSIGKSSLACTIALDCAMETSGPYSGIFVCAHGPVLMATYEDPPGTTKERLTTLARHIDQARGNAAAAAALERIQVLNLESWPLYGAPDLMPYSARPGPLPGWRVLWSAVEKIQPKLIIVDPALKAFKGEPNNTAPVRDFLGDLRYTMNAVSTNGAGALLTAHSNKETRNSRNGRRPDPFDPGQTAGSAGWTDEARGVLTLTWAEHRPGRVLAIAKATLGPARLLLDLAPVAAPDGLVAGFTSASGWRSPDQAAAPPEPAARPARQKTLTKTSTPARERDKYDGIEE